MKDRRTVIKSRADMDTQVRSPAGLAPPYRQVCVFAPATTTTGLPPLLTVRPEILPRPRLLDFPAKLLLASPLNPPADRLLRGLFTNLPASDRSLAHERNLTAPSTLLFTLSLSCPVISKRTRVHGRWRSVLFVCCVYNLAGLLRRVRVVGILAACVFRS